MLISPHTALMSAIFAIIDTCHAIIGDIDAIAIRRRHYFIRLIFSLMADTPAFDNSDTYFLFRASLSFSLLIIFG
jgi:hypothetical protein